MSLVGNLEDLGLGDILQIVSLSRKSGVLSLAWGEVKGKIIFRDGQVVVANSTGSAPSLPRLLSEHGAFPSSSFETAEQQINSLPDAAAVKQAVTSEYGVKPDVFDEVLRQQIESSVFHFFSWPEGTFNFELQEIEPELNALKPPYHAFVLEHGLSPQFLAMEGTRLQDEHRRKSQGAPVGPPLKTGAEEGGKPAPPPEPEAPPPPKKDPDEPEDEGDFSSVADALAFYEGKAQGEAPAEPEKEAPPEPEKAAPPPPPPPPPPTRNWEIVDSVDDKPEPEPMFTAKPEPAPPPPSKPKEPAPPADEGAPDLVVVDDEPFVIESITHHLGAKGYRTRSFTSVGKALDYLQESADLGESPRAVLADLIMPDLDGKGTLGGLKVLEDTRSINPAIAVIMMTDYENQPARDKAEALGGKFFFTKPKASQLDEDYGSPELMNFIQVLMSALESLTRDKAAAREPAGGAPPAPESGGGEDLVNLGDELRREFGEEVKPEGEEDDELTPSRGLHMLKAMISELNDPGANGQITLLILRFAAELMNRAVIFLVAKNQLAGLGQFGIEIDGVDAQKHVRQIRIPLNQPSIFREAIQKRMPLKKALKKTRWHDYLVETLGGAEPSEVFVAPIIAGGKIAALIYGDNVPENREIGDTESLEIFLAQAGLAMEKALLERRLKEIAQPEPGEAPAAPERA